MNRRNFLKGGALASLGLPEAVPAFIGPLTSDKFTPLAAEYNAFFGEDLTDYVPTFGTNDDPMWVVTYDPENESGIRGFTDRDDTILEADLETQDKLIVRASKGTVGLDYISQALGNGLQSLSGVERIDLVLSMGRPDPVGSLGSEEDFEHPRKLFRSYDYGLEGIAFDADVTTIGTTRETLRVTDADMTFDSTSEPVKVGVADTGCNVANGRVFGRGQRGSPIRIPKAKSFVDGTEAADVAEGRAKVTNSTRREFQEGNLKNFAHSNVDGDDALDFSPPSQDTTVSSTSDWNAGTFDTVVVNSGTIALDTYTVEEYESPGTYTSVWYDFGASTTFSTNTTDETTNGETISWEYRSSSDGTSGTASSWVSSLGDVPEDQFLQVRISLETTDAETTPQVHSFDIDGEFIVDTESEWNAGTFDTTDATSSGDLELSTTTVDYYETSGTYTSEWHDSGEDVRIDDVTTDETLNGQTITWEYRSSSDGDPASASSWYSDVANVPTDQYVQTRATLETADDTTSPEVTQYTVSATEILATYTGQSLSLLDVDGAWIDIELTSVDVTAALEGYDTDTESWASVDDFETSSTGVHEFNVSDDDYRDYRIDVEFESTATDASGRLYEDGIETPNQILNDASDWSAVADGDGHGTWCAAQIAADPMDDAYRGVAADANVEIYIAKVLGDGGGGSTKSIIQAIDWFSAEGVDVINLSLGSQIYNESIDDAIQSFLENGGSAVVVAAGNDRQISRLLNSPADSEHATAVAATTNEDPAEASVGNFSNVSPDDGARDLSNGETQGRMIDVGAPGISLEAEVPDTTGTLRYRDLTGTSMAAPNVTGLLALLLAAEPSLKGDYEAVKERLKASCHPIFYAGETEVGSGMPQADKLLAGEENSLKQADELEPTAAARDAANRAISGQFLSGWF